jgi:transposase-like protein
MNKNRKKCSSEFKEEAVKLITEQGYKITEAVRNLGVNATEWAYLTSDRKS